jgi:N-methylhydantoinase B
MEATPQPIGMGADLYGDGENCLLHHSEGATRNVPIEVKESRDPLMIERYELRQDSGGSGLHRGGLGMERDYRFLSDGYILGVLERGKFPHWGVKGGKPGARNYGLVTSKQKGQFEILKQPELPLKAGDTVTNYTGGGGGWGDPFNRDPKKVLDDVINEYVSLESAKNEYGVLIRKIDSEFIIDQKETDKLREKGSSA